MLAAIDNTATMNNRDLISFIFFRITNEFWGDKTIEFSLTVNLLIKKGHEFLRLFYPLPHSGEHYY